MYQDKEILDINCKQVGNIFWSYGYGEVTLTELFESINTESVRVLCLDNYLTSKPLVEEMIGLLPRFPKLEWIILYDFNLEVYDLIVHILTNYERVVIDLRNGNLLYSKLYDNYIKLLKDLVSDRLLLFWCEDCSANFFSDDPNKCDKCDIMSCKSCHSKCISEYNYIEPPHTYPTKEIEKCDVTYYDLYNFITYDRNRIICSDCRWLGFDESKCKHPEYMTEQEYNTKLRFKTQKLKTCLYGLIDNIPDDIIDSIYDSLMIDKRHPDYRPLSKNQIKAATIKYLKDYSIDDTGKFPQFIGPIFDLFNDMNEPNGWYVINLNSFYHRHKLYQYVDTDAKTIINENRISVKALNLMSETYQYCKCKCSDPNDQ